MVKTAGKAEFAAWLPKLKKCEQVVLSLSKFF
jgi:hypothetical protein